MYFNDGTGNSLSDGTQYSIIDDWLDAIDCFRLIISVETCQSGTCGNDFNDGDNPCPRIIYTAGNSVENTDSSYSIAFHDALGDDSTAFNSADTNNNGHVSVREAFNYGVTQATSTPQEFGNIALGNQLYLGEYR